jgi:hypothetical protein
MGVLHAFQCRAHGTFETIVAVKKKGVTIPKCPRGCSKSFVKLIFVQAPGHIRPGTKRADRLVREAAELQGLSDISTSPSRSGGSVMDRLRKKNRTYPEAAAARAGDYATMMPALTHKENAMTDRVGLGNKYDASEWKKNEAGQLVHTAAGHKTPNHTIPMGATGVSIDRVKEKNR